MLDTIATTLGEKPKFAGMKTAHDLISNSGMNWRTYFAKVAWDDHDLEHTDRWGVTQQNPAPSRRWVDIEDKRMVLRSDTREALGLVGDQFEPIDNIHAFGIADPIIAQGGEFVGCGEYERGALAWVQVKMPIDPADVVNGDTIMPYLLIVTGHTGNRSLTYKMTTIRVVCKNTLYAALRGKTPQSGSIKHSGDIKAKTDFATSLLEKHRIFFNDTVGIFQKFATTTIKQPSVERYFKTIAKVEPRHYKNGEMIGRPGNMYDKYMTAYHGSRHGAELGRGTVWGAYNAVTAVQDHDMVEEKRTDTAHKSAKDRAAYQYFEASPRISQDAFNLALEYVTKGDNAPLVNN